jgi:hypothetical protein
MAIKPLKRYGKFTAPRRDQSGEIAMRALAGLGEDITRLGGSIAQVKKVETQQAQKLKDQQAVLDAPTVGFEQGQKALDTGEYAQTLGAGATQRAASAQAGYIASFDNLFAQTIEDARSTAQNSTEFLNMTQGALDGLMQGYGNLPPAWLDRAQTNAQQMIKTAVGPIVKKETAIALENNKIEFDASEQTIGNLQSNLAFQGDLANLELSRTNQSLAHNLALEQGIKADAIDTLKPSHIENLQYQYFRGSLDRQIYDNDELSLDDKLEAAQGSINALRDADSLAGINPNDAETSLTLSKETQAKFADNLEKEMKDFFEAEKAKLQEKELADQINGLQKKNEFIDSVMDSDLPIDELLVKVNKEQIDTGQDLADLRRYLNSKKSVEAQPNPELTGRIIAQVYDINADMEMEQDGSRYLNALRNIKMDIMQKRASGELSAANELALLKQIKTLTSAKSAEATTLLASNWYKASNAVKKSVAPEDYGLAVRAMHFMVEEQIEQYRQDNNGAEPPQQMVQTYWNSSAVTAANQVNSDRRQKTLEKLQTPQQTKLPVVSSQDDYDKLESGQNFIENGVEYRKP